MYLYFSFNLLKKPVIRICLACLLFAGNPHPRKYPTLFMSRRRRERITVPCMLGMHYASHMARSPD